MKPIFVDPAWNIEEIPNSSKLTLSGVEIASTCSWFASCSDREDLLSLPVAQTPCDLELQAAPLRCCLRTHAVRSR